jgi:hypothetical protein
MRAGRTRTGSRQKATGTRSFADDRGRMTKETAPIDRPYRQKITSPTATTNSATDHPQDYDPHGMLSAAPVTEQSQIPVTNAHLPTTFNTIERVENGAVVTYESNDWPEPTLLTNVIDFNANHREQQRQWQEQLSATSPVVNQVENLPRGPRNNDQRKMAQNIHLAQMEAERQRALIGDCDLWGMEAQRRYR